MSVVKIVRVLNATSTFVHPGTRPYSANVGATFNSDLPRAHHGALAACTGVDKVEEKEMIAHVEVRYLEAMVSAAQVFEARKNPRGLQVSDRVLWTA